MNDFGSRPDYLVEFERRLAAALPQRVDTKRQSASIRSSSGEGAAQLPPVEPRQPSSKAPETGTPNSTAASALALNGASQISIEGATAPLARTDGGDKPVGGLSSGVSKLSSMEMPAGKWTASPADPGDASSGDDASQGAQRSNEPDTVAAATDEGGTSAVSLSLSTALAQRVETKRQSASLRSPTREGAERHPPVEPRQPSSKTPGTGTPSSTAASALALNGASQVSDEGAAAPPAQGTEGGHKAAGGLSSRASRLSRMETPAGEWTASLADPSDASPGDYACRGAQRSNEPFTVPAETDEGGPSTVSLTAAGMLPQKDGVAFEKPIAEPPGRDGPQTIGTHTQTGEPMSAEQGAQGKIFRVLMLATSVTMVGAVSLAAGMLVPILERPSSQNQTEQFGTKSASSASSTLSAGAKHLTQSNDATKPSLEESSIPDSGGAKPPESAEALPQSATSSAIANPTKDRSEVYSAATDATVGARRAADAAEVDSFPPPGDSSNQKSPASMATAPDTVAPATPPQAQSSSIKPAPTPTLSPPPRPTSSPIYSSASPLEAKSEDAGPPSPLRSAGSAHEVTPTGPSPPTRDLGMKVSDPHSTPTAVMTKGTTRPGFVARTPAKHGGSAKKLNAARPAPESTATASTPAATNGLGGLY